MQTLIRIIYTCIKLDFFGKAIPLPRRKKVDDLTCPIVCLFVISMALHCQNESYGILEKNVMSLW